MKSYIDLFKAIVSCAETGFDAMLASLAHSLKNIKSKNRLSRKSVLLKSLGVIGDYVLLTASFEGYRVLFKDYTIVLLVRKEVRDFAIRNPYIDEIIFVDYWGIRRNPFKKIGLWLSLLKYDFAVAVNLDYSTHFDRRDTTIIDWSLAEKKIAHQCLDDGAKRDYSKYDVVISHKEKWMFEVDRNNEMIHQLGYSDYDNYKTEIFGLNGYELRRGIKGLLPEKSYYVVCPGSLEKRKQWSSEGFASVIKSLEGYGYVIILCGSKSELSISKNIMSRISLKNAVDLTGKTTLLELAAIIRGARWLISNDSAAAHIANAVKTQAFVILGGGDFGRFLPYPRQNYIHAISNGRLDCFNCYWNCKYDSYKCINDISVESVKDEISKLVQLQ